MAVDQLSRAFVALADPTRRDIVARLSVRDATVGELAESYAMSMQAVSKHLKVLEEAGLVSRSRDAQRRPCHLEPQVFDLMTSWIERYRRQAEERFRRLDAVLAAMADEAADDGSADDDPTGDEPAGGGPAHSTETEAGPGHEGEKP
ncbi:ArsR/SmtB family transcription factor [Kitasatospora sp. NPDC059722]|uniref:ArsR/SmtB family transcription factor n=1 Tax=unclassified Kitasatospora TaxID=2633591 RepID=UPI00365DCD8E